MPRPIRARPCSYFRSRPKKWLGKRERRHDNSAGDAASILPTRALFCSGPASNILTPACRDEENSVASCSSMATNSQLKIDQELSSFVILPFLLSYWVKLVKGKPIVGAIQSCLNKLPMMLGPSTMVILDQCLPRVGAGAEQTK